MSEYASGTSVLAYKSSKHHAYVLSDTSGGRYSKKSELKSLLLVLDTLSSHLNLKRMTCLQFATGLRAAAKSDSDSEGLWVPPISLPCKSAFAACSATCRQLLELAFLSYR